RRSGSTRPVSPTPNSLTSTRPPTRHAATRPPLPSATSTTPTPERAHITADLRYQRLRARGCVVLARAARAGTYSTELIVPWRIVSLHAPSGSLRHTSVNRR